MVESRRVVTGVLTPHGCRTSDNSATGASRGRAGGVSAIIFVYGRLGHRAQLALDFLGTLERFVVLS